MQHRLLQKIRKEYLKSVLDENFVHPDPFIQFEVWFDEAIRVVREDANAMALASVNDHGEPSARMVLLKSFDERGFVFFTNYDSRKGSDLSGNPRAALLFYWKEMERQVRICGRVKKTSRLESDDYFRSRPMESRISAFISPQSKIIPDRDFLETKSNDLRKSGKAIKRPVHWGGYRLVPDVFEFWQGRENRLHDRIAYSKKRSGWELSRLAP
jgi:pyridoxamine 5'-phosphate oxidase